MTHEIELTGIVQTPWGVAQYAVEHAPGIVFYGTSSHGGFRLDDHHNATVPGSMRAATWCGRGERGWYEEDCDWSIVARMFPEAFSAEECENAARIFDYFLARKLAAV